MQLIGFLFFWIVIYGLNFLLKSKFNVKDEISMILVFSMVSLLLFFFGLLNMLLFASIIITLIGLFFFFKTLIKDKNTFINYYKSKNNILFLLIICLMTYIYIGLHPTHYDNFSHWALIVKNMWLKNALPNFEDSIIQFQSYQPGSACFIYFVGLFLGRLEGTMVVGQNYITFVFLFSLFALIKDNKMYKYFVLIFGLLLVFISVCNVPFNNLLVDVTISVICISCMVTAYLYQNHTKQMFWVLLPISLFLVLVKNSGIVFVLFNCLYLFVTALKNRKSDVKYAVILGGLCLLLLYVWKQHVSYVFGSSGLIAPHSLSLENFKNTLYTKGLSGVFSFLKIYCDRFFDLKNNPNQIIMLLVNFIFILLAISFKENRKRILGFLVTCDFIYLLYYGVLGIMYILSMDGASANNLAGFDRYLFTGSFICVGNLVMNLFLLGEKTECRFKMFIIVMIGICFLLGLIFTFKKCNLTLLIGKQQYRDTYLYKLDLLSETLPSDLKDEDVVVLYTNGYISYDGEYVHASKYKFYHNNTIVISDINMLPMSDDKRIIAVALNFDDVFANYMKEKDFNKITNQIYES